VPIGLARAIDPGTRQRDRGLECIVIGCPLSVPTVPFLGELQVDDCTFRLLFTRIFLDSL
jgi:hypothetical protein